MELATAQMHRALAYLVAVNDNGYRPTREELEGYAARPDRTPNPRS
jgi:hypothetical protein